MKNIILIVFLILPITLSARPYSEKYASQSKEAFDYYILNIDEFNKVAAITGLSPEFVFGIIAPELSQFGFLNNLAQTGLLKYLYVQGGKVYADYSIGYFQMKPSFIERLEESVQQNEMLKQQFQNCIIENPDSHKGRGERVKRLTQPEWQFSYLALFCMIMQERFADKEFPNKEEKLRFYAAAYNTGFHKPESVIEQFTQKALFPLLGMTKYNYSDVSLWFYRELKEQSLAVSH